MPNAHGAIRAVEAKVDEMIVFMSASESHNQKNVNRSIDESLDGFERVAQIAGDAGIPVHGAIATGFGCPFEGDVSLDTIVKIAKRYHEYGFTGVGLGDTTGMATPPIVTKFVRTLQDAVPEMDIALHFHNTRGIGLVNVVAGLDEGIDKYDASFAGIGGCPFAPKATGNICTEDLVYMLDEMGIRDRDRYPQDDGNCLRCGRNGRTRSSRTGHEGGSSSRPARYGRSRYGQGVGNAPHDKFGECA